MPEVQVAVVDDRVLLASGLRTVLATYAGIRVVDVDAVPPGGTVLVGLCAVPYAPPPGLRIVELRTERSVVDTVRTLRSDVVEPVRRRKRGQALSEREQAILDMTADGSSASEIAAALGVSARTVERHRRAVADKLAVRSSSHAVAIGALVTDGTADDVNR